MIPNASFDHPGVVLFVVLTVGLSAVGAVTAAGPTSTAPAEQHAEATAAEPAFNGTILNPGGQPLANTQVAITDDTGTFGVLTETASNGQFSVTDVDPGVRTLVASAQGYGDSAPVTVDIGSNATDVVFQLTTATDGRLDGTVSNADGETLDAGTMVAFQSSAFESSRSVQLDSGGSYELDELPIGEYTVTVTTENRSSVATVSVDGEGPTTQNFSLAPSGETVLTGHVTDTNGTPLPAGTWVRFEADNGFGPPRTVSLGEGGQYALTDLPTDGKSYNLKVEAEDIGSTTTIVSLPSAADTERDFKLPRTEPLSIESLDAPEQAVAGSEVTATLTISNAEPTPVTEGLQYRVDGRPVDSATMTVDGVSTRTISVSFTPTQTGSFTHGVFSEHDAAYAEIEIVSAGSVGDGDENDGDDSGGDDDGNSGGVGGISLPPVGGADDGETTPVDDSGDDDTAGTGGQNDSTDDSPATNSTDSTTDSSDDEQSEQESPDGTDTDSTNQESESEADSGDGQPGFGVLVSFCALLAGLGLARRRH
jgi:PGF-CTERM protein